MPKNPTTSSPEGVADVARIAAVLAMGCPEEFGTVPDCSCPHEHWHLTDLGGACLDVHLEEDGSAHVIFDWGDGDAEHVIASCSDLSVARAEAFAWVSSLALKEQSND